MTQPVRDAYAFDLDERGSLLRRGWLRRGLESARIEAASFPAHRKAALDTDTEFPIGDARCSTG